MFFHKVLPFSCFFQYINVRYLKINKEFRSKVKNNELNLEKIINEYHNYVQKIIENMTGPYLAKEDKEEILSDTFFILWKNKEKIEENRPLKPYIAGIIRNLVKEKRKVISFHCDIQDYENSIPDIKSMDMLYEQREKTKLIQETVKGMKEQDIDIFKLYYYASKKIKEIAEILDISEFNVKTRLYRIRKRIKQDLEKGGYSNE